MRQVNIAVVELILRFSSTTFHQMNFNAWMMALIFVQKCRESVLYHLWRSANSERSNLPAFESSRSVAKRLDIRQHAATAP